MSDESVQIIPELLKTLSNDQSRLQRLAALELAKLGTQEVILGLIKILEHPEEKVQAWAAWALGKIENEIGVNQLTQSLNHHNSSVRIWAIWSIAQMRNAMGMKALAKALNHPDAQVRSRAAYGLGKIAVLLKKYQSQDAKKSALISTIVWRILPLLKDKDHYVRGNVANILGEIGLEVSVKELTKTLQDDKFSVVCRTVESLGKIGNEQAIDILISALDNPDSYIRSAIVSALGKIPNEQALKGVFMGLEDQDLFVRGRAVSALGEIGTERAEKAIQNLLNDPELYVRHKAEEALELIKLEKAEIPPVYDLGIAPELLPKIIISSYSEACEYIRRKDPIFNHIISIGSPDTYPPPGFNKIKNKLRLEFDDIEYPRNNIEYVLPTKEHINKVIQFVAIIAKDKGNVLIHCHAGISRSAAVALIVWAVLLGRGNEKSALDMVFAVRSFAHPNRWIVELADEILNREGELINVLESNLT